MALPQPLIDITRLAARLLEGKRPTGVDRVSLAYLTHLGGSSQALIRHWGHWIPFEVGASGEIFEAISAHRVKAAWTIRWHVVFGLLSSRRTVPGSFFFNTGHSGLDHPNYATRIRRYGLRPVYFLHDLIPLTHPEYCRPGEADKHRQRLATMLDTGVALILNSAATQRDLLAYAQALGKPVPPHVVAALGIPDLPLPAPQPLHARPYFVMLGTIEPRKNHLLLLHLWRAMAEAGEDDIPTLVIIGQRGWECEQVIDLLERCPAVRRHVIEVNDCDDAALSTWLHHARALLFPSFVEGFGIPLVEALAAGVPVIASNLAVFREVAGDIPDYLDPTDGPGWRRAVRAYVAPDSPARAAQLARLAGWHAPTWDDQFAIVKPFLAGLEAG